MIPIFEQGKGTGIGHSFDSFLRRFTEICKEQVDKKKAKSFAFILYDFCDESVKNILRKQGGFAKLDRMSGSELSIFYIDSDSPSMVKKFNQIFLRAFEIEKKAHLPFVLFFNIIDDDVEGVQIVELEQNDIMFAFDELYRIFENYILRAQGQTQDIVAVKSNKLLQFADSIPKVALDKFIGFLITKGGDYVGHQAHLH